MSARPAPTRRPTDPARRWLVVAGVAALCSLGLSWGAGGGGEGSLQYVPGSYTPGFCSTSYGADGWAYTDCSAGSASPGYILGSGTGTSGTGSTQPARVFLALAATAVVFGYRRSDRRLVLAAPVMMAVGLAVTGLNPGPGMVAYTFGLACLVWGLHLDGALRLPRRAPSTLSPI